MRSAFGPIHKIAAQPVYHGTTDAAWRGIKRLGLKRSAAKKVGRWGGTGDMKGTFVTPDYAVARRFATDGWKNHAATQDRGRVITYNVVGIKPKAVRTNTGIRESVYRNKDLNSARIGVSGKLSPRDEPWDVDTRLPTATGELRREAKKQLKMMKTRADLREAALAGPPMSTSQLKKKFKRLSKDRRRYGSDPISQRAGKILLDQSARRRLVEFNRTYGPPDPRTAAGRR